MLFVRRVVTHHRRGGNIVSQAQEEIILIASFGLFWLGKLQFSIPPRVAGREKRMQWSLG